jgi:hypothetical protein
MPVPEAHAPEAVVADIMPKGAVARIKAGTIRTAVPAIITGNVSKHLKRASVNQSPRTRVGFGDFESIKRPEFQYTIIREAPVFT